MSFLKFSVKFYHLNYDSKHIHNAEQLIKKVVEKKVVFVRIWVIWLKKIGRIILTDYVNDSLLYYKIPKDYYDEVIKNNNEIILEF
jgi:hypothetical protein